MAIFDLFCQYFHKTTLCEDPGSKISGNVPEYLTYPLEKEFSENSYLSQKYDKKYTMCSFYQFTDCRHGLDCVLSLICIKDTIRMNAMYLGQ